MYNKKVEMVGRLATEAENDGRSTVFINKTSGNIQYKVRSLSVKTEVKSELFMGFLDSIDNLDFEDNKEELDAIRIRKFKDYCSDKLFIFTHFESQVFFNIDSAYLITLPNRSEGIIKEDSHFIAIPCFRDKDELTYIKDTFSLNRTSKTYEDFKRNLIENNPIGKVYNLNLNDASNFADFVIWQDDAMMKILGPLKNKSNSSYGGSLTMQVNSNYHEIVIDETSDILLYVFQSEDNPTLLHMELDKYNEIMSELEKNISDVSADTESTENSELDSGEEKSKEESINKIDETKVLIPQKNGNELDEREIFDAFRYQCSENKLFYNPKDIVNFHTALKTGSLVILSGMSGTGKSRLIDTYAEALGIHNYLMIPVRPSWNDDSDLLGYVDSVHMVYRPSDTGFIDTLVEAQKEENENTLYLICFDEMNLARVEHYFSQFLSILEKTAEKRELVLYDKSYENRLYNKEKYPSVIKIRNNIKFVGTVNIDESTYHFSDKVLDRANVITLDVLDYSIASNWKNPKYSLHKIPVWNKDDYEKLIKQDDTENEDKYIRVRELLWALHTLLNNTNSNLGVGPRILKSIEKYLKNIPASFEEFNLSFEEGLDDQIAQRVFTKIRGPEEQIKDIFKDNKIEKIFNLFADLSSFTKCRKILEQKEKELKIYGYCV